MNKALCATCGALVPAHSEERGGRVFLVKECPACGRSEVLVSADAARYQAKRALDDGPAPTGCGLDCLECGHRRRPQFIFIDVTNRCNLNCPICINNTPSMGFLFEPPLSYFDRVFKALARYDPRPEIQLFGGEPTVRQDLFDIILLARSHGLKRIRVVTNGVRLADEEYCRRLVESRATILLGYDGANPETYRVLRRHADALPRKQQAIENLRRIPRAKLALMTCFAKGFNDREMRDLLAYCHERREVVRAVNFMPLSQVWDPAEFNLTCDRTTGDDVEVALAACFPDDLVEFMPAGISGLRSFVKYFRFQPPAFAGAHPNCESMYLLVSNGREYVPISRYLKRPLSEFARHYGAAEARFARRVLAKGRSIEGLLPRKVDLTDRLLKVRAVLGASRSVFRNVRVSRFFKGWGPAKAWHALCFAVGVLSRRPTPGLVQRHMAVQRVLQVFVLPFEDTQVLETERLERCPTAFAFWDPADGEVKTVPVCAWCKHKNEVLRRIADHYAGA